MLRKPSLDSAAEISDFDGADQSPSHREAGALTGREVGDRYGARRRETAEIMATRPAGGVGFLGGSADCNWSLFLYPPTYPIMGARNRYIRLAMWVDPKRMCALEMRLPRC